MYNSFSVCFMVICSLPEMTNIKVNHFTIRHLHNCDELLHFMFTFSFLSNYIGFCSFTYCLLLGIALWECLLTSVGSKNSGFL